MYDTENNGAAAPAPAAGRGSGDAASPPPASPGRSLARIGALALAAWIAPYLWQPRRFALLDHVDLAIHEAGHLVFAPFGEFTGIAGGTLLQLIVPATFVAYFHLRGERFAAAVVLLWLAQSLFNVATYMADARARVLPLVGGPDVIHDWEWMLFRLRLLEHDRMLGGITRAVAALTWAAATAGIVFLPVSGTVPED